MSLPANYIKIINEEGISLKEIGINAVAFSGDVALNAINKLKGTNIVIVGGDVYEFKCGIPNLTYYNWSIDEKGNEKKSEYIKASIEKAICYITEFNKKYGDDYLYRIILSEE